MFGFQACIIVPSCIYFHIYIYMSLYFVCSSYLHFSMASDSVLFHTCLNTFGEMSSQSFLIKALFVFYAYECFTCV